MILKDIYLYPELSDFSDETVKPFKYQSRSICNFLARHIKGLKFKTEGFRRICFIGSESPSEECTLYSTKVLCVEFFFDESKYLSLNESELNDYFIELLKEGIEKCDKQFDIPSKELLLGLELFKSEGYINEWRFKNKAVKQLGVKCALDCKLTMKNFHLSMSVTKGKDLIWQEEILKTVPNEIVFDPMIKDVVFEEDKLVVVDKLGDITFTLPVTELSL